MYCNSYYITSKGGRRIISEVMKYCREPCSISSFLSHHSNNDIIPELQTLSNTVKKTDVFNDVAYPHRRRCSIALTSEITRYRDTIVLIVREHIILILIPLRSCETVSANNG